MNSSILRNSFIKIIFDKLAGIFINVLREGPPLKELA